MIAVMQCAGSKRHAAGMMRNGSGESVYFVGQPHHAPANPPYAYARPDDLAEDVNSWRQQLLQYNERPDNPYGLSTAFELYEPPTYRHLVSKLGIERSSSSR